MFKQLLKNELKRAFNSRGFYVAFVIALILIVRPLVRAVTLFWSDVDLFSDYLARTGQNTFYKMWGSFNSLSCLIGTGFDENIFLSFTMLLPLLVALPYGWSLCKDYQTKYNRVLIEKVGKWRYFGAKWLAAFISGFGFTLICYLISLILATALLPTYTSYTYYPLASGVTHLKMLVLLQVYHPIVYYSLIIFIYCVYAGLYACLPLVVSCYVKSRTLSIIVPFLILFGLLFIEMLGILKLPIYLIDNQTSAKLTPLLYLNQNGFYNTSFGWLLFVAVLLIVIIVGHLMYQASKKDVL